MKNTFNFKFSNLSFDRSQNWWKMQFRFLQKKLWLRYQNSTLAWFRFPISIPNFDRTLKVRWYYWPWSPDNLILLIQVISSGLIEKVRYTIVYTLKLNKLIYFCFPIVIWRTLRISYINSRTPKMHPARRQLVRILILCQPCKTWQNILACMKWTKL